MKIKQEVFGFGDCQLSVSTRELRVHGQVRPVEPRPFDLLLYLLRHHDRVVSKDELLSQVWSGESVTPGAIASAVMKVRKLIGDTDAAQPLIRTVHGTGYRFNGPIRGHAPHAEAPAAAGCALALLPFENRSQQADLDWIELGLLSMVLKTLARNTWLDVASIPSVLQALQTTPGGAPLEKRTEALRRLLGARDVVRTVVFGRKGSYRIEATILGAAGAVQQEQWSGADLLQLAQQMAAHLEGFSEPGRAVQASDEAHDSVAGWTLGRALQAAAEQKWHAALDLLEATLRVEPEHPVARLERLRAWVALDDNAAFDAGHAMAKAARDAGDRPREAAVQFELAQIYAKRRLNERAREHLDESMKLAEGNASAQWQFNVNLLRGELAMSRFDWDTAAAALDRAEALCSSAENVFDRIQLLSTRVVLRATTGAMRQAWAHARQAADLCREHGLKVGQARAECNYANASASLGLYDLGERHGELALALSREMKAATFTAVSASLLCGIYRTTHKPHHLIRVLRAFDQLDADGSPSNPMYHLVSQAQLKLSMRRYAEAAVLLNEAGERAREAGRGLEHHFVLPLLTAALLHAGDIDAAEATCARMQAGTDIAHERNLHAAALHCQAQIALARGDRHAALQHLRDAWRVAPEGYWRAHAGLDGAWLAIETGATAEAWAMLAGLEAWLDETPAGMALSARLAFAEGRIDAAHERHAQLAQSLAAAVPEYWAALGACYAAGAAGTAAEPGAAEPLLPLSPRLPTWV
jgi:DNA-binding winged helix-turn-helix (wHTH) protein/tetratricopeptide (TPR) repeat protein